MKYHRFKVFGVAIPNRYIVLALIILGILAAIRFPPVLPHIQVAPEAYPHSSWTNTMTAMVLADIVILLVAFAVNRAAKSGELVPKGLPGVIEAFIEVIHNLTESTAGKWTKVIFPVFASITLFVLVVNWMELIPGVDSIGFLHETDHGGHSIEQVMRGVYTVMDDEVEHGGYVIIPFVRVLSTDLNFTVGLALIAVVMVQVIGVRALGPGYFSKFLNLKALWNFFKQPMGIIDFGVGILEIVSEFSKILSFSFRLFGNIFAGSVMLFVIGTLVPVVAQVIFLVLELFVGLIQAFVFGMLTMVFMTQATVSHGDHDHDEEHAD